MMALLFCVGGDNYGINVRDIAEVLPRVSLKHFPHGPEHVAGLLNYHGRVVPVIDLTLLLSAHAACDRVNSRIVLVDYHRPGGAHHLLGLLVDKVTETMKIPDHALTRSGVMTNESPFLGDVAIHNGIMVQVIDINQVLPEAVQSRLFHDDNKNGAVIVSSKGC